MFSGTILGRLGSDPVVRTTLNGATVVSLNVAITGTGTDKVPTVWIQASAWGKTGELLEGQQKGDLVCLSGAFGVRVYDKDGVPVQSITLNVASFSYLPNGRAHGSGSQPAQSLQTPETPGAPEQSNDALPF